MEVILFIAARGKATSFIKEDSQKAQVQIEVFSLASPFKQPNIPTFAAFTEREGKSHFFPRLKSILKVPCFLFFSLLTHTDFRRKPVTTIIINNMQIII